MDRLHSITCYACQGRRAIKGAVCEVCDGKGHLVAPSPDPVEPPASPEFAIAHLKEILSQLAKLH